MPSTLIPKHKLLIISVGKSLDIRDSVYDAVRHAWKLSVDRAKESEYIIAHKSGTVIGVFTADEWLPADSDEFKSLSGFGDVDPSRWGFIGQDAPQDILNEYMDCELPAELRKRGASNPIRFLDPEEEPTETFSTLEEALESLQATEEQESSTGSGVSIPITIIPTWNVEGEDEVVVNEEYPVNVEADSGLLRNAIDNGTWWDFMRWLVCDETYLSQLSNIYRKVADPEYFRIRVHTLKFDLDDSSHLIELEEVDPDTFWESPVGWVNYEMVSIY